LAAKELNEEKIRNPKYKGSWEEQLSKRQPLRKENGNAYLLDAPIGAIGIEIITVDPGVVFDNFLITDSEAEA
jgi:hypothetical protein